MLQIGYFVALIALLAGGYWVHWRRRRIEAFRIRAQQPLGTSPTDGAKVENPGSRGAAAIDHERPDSGLLAATALSSVSAVGFLWQWATLDPKVVAAYDFAHRADLDSSWDVVRHLWEGYLSQSPVSQEGIYSRLLGYVGEQQAAEQLTLAGHTVALADTSNHPVWDLLLDGDIAVDVKTHANLGDVDALHDGVLYAVPEDASGTVAENMMVVDGFRHEDVADLLDGALAQASGEAAFESLQGGLPVATVAMVALREARAVRAGKTVSAALEHGAITSVVRAAAAVGGWQVGAAVGTAVAGPIGTAVGAVLGAGISVIAVQPLTNRLRMRRFNSANRKLVAALRSYGRQFVPVLSQLRELVTVPARQARAAIGQLEMLARRVRRSLRWWLAPTFGQVVALEAVGLGQRRFLEIQGRTEATNQLLVERSDGRYEQLGAVMVAAPMVVARVGVHAPEAIENVIACRGQVAAERQNLTVKR